MNEKKMIKLKSKFFNSLSTSKILSRKLSSQKKNKKSLIELPTIQSIFLPNVEPLICQIVLYKKKPFTANFSLEIFCSGRAEQRNFKYHFPKNNSYKFLFVYTSSFKCCPSQLCCQTVVHFSYITLVVVAVVERIMMVVGECRLYFVAIKVKTKRKNFFQ